MVSETVIRSTEHMPLVHADEVKMRRDISSVLVANRGEIAVRIIRTCQRLGIKTIAVHSSVERSSLHVEAADMAIELPGHPVAAYLDADSIIKVAVEAGVTAIHPGYGFLSERPDFAQRVIDAGLIWIGPSPEVIDLMGNKVQAREVAKNAGVPVTEGVQITGEGQQLIDLSFLLEPPIMVKAAAGGGGIGMERLDDISLLPGTVEKVASAGQRFFGNSEVLVERFIENARHVEVQILGLRNGTVLALGARDCSVQRRNQKLAEETPAPGITDALAARLANAAVSLGEHVGYEGAGTVEFLLDLDRQDFVFLELNSRLQVEHPITELVTGIDLVEQQLLVAANDPAAITVAPPVRGHALEFRVCAEDPKTFYPGPGKITEWQLPHMEGVRVDAGYRSGDEITPFFDSLIAKLCVYGENRSQALSRMRKALQHFRVSGPVVNLEFFDRLLDNSEFLDGSYDTKLVTRIDFNDSSVNDNDQLMCAERSK